MSMYAIEEFKSIYGKPTVLEIFNGTRKEARALAREYLRKDKDLKVVRERWIDE